MECVDMVCPAVKCAADEILSEKDDQCCSVCSKSWVQVGVEL